jgi:hypothetical protein
MKKTTVLYILITIIVSVFSTGCASGDPKPIDSLGIVKDVIKKYDPNFLDDYQWQYIPLAIRGEKGASIFVMSSSFPLIFDEKKLNYSFSFNQLFICNRKSGTRVMAFLDDDGSTSESTKVVSTIILCK